MNRNFSPPLLHPLNGKVTVDVSRREGGQYVRGVWQAALPIVFQITANIQPVLKSTDTQILPEGDRTKECIKVYTTTPLLQRREGESPVEGDIITWDGKLFEVMKAIEYKMGFLNHWKIIAVRKEIT